MRTHILMALLALVVSACASKENISERQQAEQLELSKFETQAQDRFR